MPRINVTIKVNGNPLRRAYVEQATSWGFATTAWHMTDDQGRVRDENGRLGVDSWTDTTDLRIRAANPVIRVLDGRTSNIAVQQEVSGLRDGATVDLNTDREQKDWFAIANRFLLTYDVVFRQFAPYRNAPDPNFPLGRARTLKDTYEQSRRIEASYPSQMPFAKVAFTEPHSTSTGHPLIHIKHKSEDRRLFGGQDTVTPDGVIRPTPILIPAEFAHALHFCEFGAAERASIQSDYLGWLTSDLAGGGDAGHAMGKVTSPMVAYLESFDHFSHRFHEHVRRIMQGATRNTTLITAPQTISRTDRQNFVTAEAAGNGVQGADVVLGPPTSSSAPLRPAFTGSEDEGAIYGAIFVDFARSTSLATAVEAYLASARDGARTFDEYREWIGDHRSRDLRALNAAALTWAV